MQSLSFKIPQVVLQDTDTHMCTSGIKIENACITYEQHASGIIQRVTGRKEYIGTFGICIYCIPEVGKPIIDITLAHLDRTKFDKRNILSINIFRRGKGNHRFFVLARTEEFICSLDIRNKFFHRLPLAGRQQKNQYKGEKSFHSMGISPSGQSSVRLL